MTATPDLFELLMGDPDAEPLDEEARDEFTRRLRAHGRVRAPALVGEPMVDGRRGITHEQTAALIEDLARMERLAKAALARIDAGAGITGASALGKIHNQARDAKRWAEAHLEAANPQILDPDPLT